VDAALAELGRSGSRMAAADAGGFTATEAAADFAPSPDLPPGAKVYVAGATTPIGKRMVRKIDAAGFEALEVPKALSAGSLADADALLIVSAAAAGAGGVEPPTLPSLMAALPDGITRLVYLSVHGVERVDRLPYSMANVFGQLDKLRAAEQDVQLRALKRVPSCSIVRIAKMKDDRKDATARCELAPGDALQGDVPASAVASVLVQALTRSEMVNATLSAGALTSGDVAVSEESHWDDEFLKLRGPEIYRRPLKSASAEKTIKWLRDWARDFLKDGQRLTTPVEIENVPNGVTLRFLLPGGVGYDLDFDKEESADDRYVASKAASSQARAKSRGTADGALTIVAEEAPFARVRVSRAEMGEGVVVKEMSEQAVLERLDRGLNVVDK